MLVFWLRTLNLLLFSITASLECISHSSGNAAVPQPGVPLSSQQRGQLIETVEPLSWEVGCLVVSSQQVSPHMLLLQTLKKVLNLKHNADMPAFQLLPGQLLFFSRLLLDSEQLRQKSKRYHQFSREEFSSSSSSVYISHHFTAFQNGLRKSSL